MIDVLCNVGVLTEGFDCPDASCIVLARPTKSFGLYRQIVGRGLRPSDGKSDCMVIDHAGLTLEHGFVDEPVEWKLSDKEKAHRKSNGTGQSKDMARVLADCPECGASRWKGRPCPACGWRGHAHAGSVDVVDGELAELHRDVERRKQVKQEALFDKGDFYQQLLWIARERGSKRGWAAHKYREKFGVWPRGLAETPSMPHPAVRSWVKSRDIAWRFSQEKATASQ